MWINLLFTTRLSVKDYLRLFYSLNKLCSSTLFMLFTAFSSVQINQYLTLEYTLTYILTQTSPFIFAKPYSPFTDAIQ